MKRTQRKLHPWIWLVAGLASGLILWLGVSTRSGLVPVSDQSPLAHPLAPPGATP